MRLNKDQELRPVSLAIEYVEANLPTDVLLDIDDVNAYEEALAFWYLDDIVARLYIYGSKAYLYDWTLPATPNFYDVALDLADPESGKKLKAYLETCITRQHKLRGEA